MKARYEFDAPDNCDNCVLLVEDSEGDFYCLSDRLLMTKEELTARRPESCPLIIIGGDYE